MKRYTGNELEHFLNDLESDLVERKESFKGDVPQEVRQAVYAFANDFPNCNEAGVLYIGAKDDGTPSDVSVTDQRLLALSDFGRDRNILLGARIQFLRFHDVKWSDDILDELRIDGTISKQIEPLDQKLISRKPYYQYPMVAMQQLTRNVIMPRSYERTSAPIMVYMLDDRIEISNGGGLYGRVTPESFGQSGIADCRNLNEAEVMKILNHVQRFRVGIQMAQNKLKANKSKPATFKHDATNTICTVWVLGGAEGVGQGTGEEDRFISMFYGEISRKEIPAKLKLKGRDNFEKLYLKPALEKEVKKGE